MGLLLRSLIGEQLEQAIWLGFSASNNEAEYEAVLSGLNRASALFASKLRIYSDSQLIVGHLKKEYEAKDEHISQYLLKVQDYLQQLDEWTVEKIPRAGNVQVDALVGIAASLPISESILLPIYVQTAPSITESPRLPHYKGKPGIDKLYKAISPDRCFA